LDWDLAWSGLAILQMIGSAAVTVHVLLRRRSPVSAAAWIGLAWLAPAAGTLLYVLLGVNRIERRGLRLRRRHVAAPVQPACCAIDPPHLMPLGRAATKITGRPLLAGNAIDPLPHGDAAYPAMLAAIEGAQTSIAVDTYIFRHDRIGRIFIEALAAAQARGVAVRVLIDGVGGGWFNSGAYHHLRRLRVPAARFLHSHLPWRMPLLNLRSHKKLMVVDGTVAFTGGVNIGDENLEVQLPARGKRRRMFVGLRRRGIRDMHFRLRGPVVGQAMAAFAEDWAFATGETLRGEMWFPAIAPAGEAFARVATSGPDHDLERIKLLKMAAITTARRRVRIVTPYFLPDDALATCLALAALRGVRVEIIVAARSDYRVMDWAMRDGLLAMVRAGCRVLWSAPPFNHSKLMTVDGAWCLIGSANWDMRSLRLNFELDVELMDPEATARIDRRIDATPVVAATPGDFLRRPIPMRLRDAVARLFLPYL
jgi:cardiolipin synthase